jgi:hypothetical protein
LVGVHQTFSFVAKILDPDDSLFLLD